MEADMAKRETRPPAEKKAAATKTEKTPNKAKKANPTGERGSAKSTRKTRKTATRVARAVSFPIVGIGASAGGLEAFQQFFTSMPPDTGMAFVLVQHLDPPSERAF